MRNQNVCQHDSSHYEDSKHELTCLHKTWVQFLLRVEEGRWPAANCPLKPGHSCPFDFSIGGCEKMSGGWRSWPKLELVGGESVGCRRLRSCISPTSWMIFRLRIWSCRPPCLLTWWYCFVPEWHCKIKERSESILDNNPTRRPIYLPVDIVLRSRSRWVIDEGCVNGGRALRAWKARRLANDWEWYWSSF